MGASLVPGTAAATPPIRGRIANRGLDGELIRTGLFFGGPPNPNSVPLYTRHPLHADRLDWTDEADIRFALQQFTSAGLNTIKLSYFGHEGEADAFASAWLFSRQRWPGDGPGNYTDAEQIAKVHQLFDVARRRGLVIAPMIEVGLSFFRFWELFPHNLDELVRRCAYLLDNFAAAPNSLRVYDAQGHARHAIFLIETIHGAPIDPQVFADGFERAADLLEQRTGRRVGWIIDPTPLPPYGSHEGPDPAVLNQTPSILAVNPFNITTQGPGAFKDPHTLTDDERHGYTELIMQRWSSSEIPFIAPIMPGYDSHLVFPLNPTYGFSDTWLARQRTLAVQHGTGGLSVDTWNGFTEGYAIPPSQEDGPRLLHWVQDTVDQHCARWG